MTAPTMSISVALGMPRDGRAAPSPVDRARGCPVLECVVNVSEGRHLDVVDADRRGRRAPPARRPPRPRPPPLGAHARRRGRPPGASPRAAVARLDLRDPRGRPPPHRRGRRRAVRAPRRRRPGRRRGGPATGSRRGPATTRPALLPATAPERSLPEVRRRAFVDLVPDSGPAQPHPTAGAVAVGARPLLVAYNLWLATPDLDLARGHRRVQLRGPAVRALGLAGRRRACRCR